MAKKQAKRQFDWRTYSKPPRLLSPAQEQSAEDGLLAPLLDAGRQIPGVALEIRARALNAYYRGHSVFRVTGEGPFLAEFESEAGNATERMPVETPEDMDGLLGRLGEAQLRIDAEWESKGRPRRDFIQVITASNPMGDDLSAAEYVFVDIEYTYGRRRYDFVALRRCEGVTGPGGFAHPRLVIGDMRTPGQSLSGMTALESVGEDLADFVKALGGAHLENMRDEILQLVAQKVRLGLLPWDLEVREIDAGLPELLVLFAGRDDLGSAAVDASVVTLHERLTARHFPTERLRFAALPAVPEIAHQDTTLTADDAMTYREFKGLRGELR